MIQNLLNFFEYVLGLNSAPPVWWQMALRAIVIFIIGIIVVRLGDKRFLGKSTAFDMLLAIIIGSILSRAINGDAPFVPTIATAFVLVLLHWLFSFVAYRSHRFGKLVKGNARTLIKDGELQWDQMRQSHITEHDLNEALHMQAKLENAQDVRIARLERSGEISVIPHDGGPQVIDIAVEAGVQTVRIKLN